MGELVNFGDILNTLSESISKSREKSGEKLKFMNIKLMIKSLTEALKLGVSMSDKDKMVEYFFFVVLGEPLETGDKLKLKTEI